MKPYFSQLLFLTILTRAYSESVPCGEPYIADNGHMCIPCPKGLFKSSDCEINYTIARCESCGQGTFQPDCTTALMCAPCQRCKALQTKLAECNATHNTVCECRNGTIWVPDASKKDEGFCRMHSKCSPGQGLERRGNSNIDTKCADCIQGKTFSNVSSLEECKVCTSCTKYKHNCTVTMDSVCDDETENVQFTGDNGSFLDVGSIIALAVVIPLVLLAAAVVLFALCFYRRRHQNSTDEKQTSSPATDEEQSVTSDDQSDRNEEEKSSDPSTVRSSFSTEHKTESASSISYAKNHNDDDSMGVRHTEVSLYSRQQTAECSEGFVTKHNSETRVPNSNNYGSQLRNQRSFEETHPQFRNGGQNGCSQTPTHSTVPDRGSQESAADNSSVPLGGGSTNVMTKPKIKTDQTVKQNSISMDVVGVPPEDGPTQRLNQQVQFQKGAHSNSEGHCLMNLKDLNCSAAVRIHGDRPQLMTGVGSQNQCQSFQASSPRPFFEEISQPVTSSGYDRHQISYDDRSDEATWAYIVNFLIDNLPMNNFKRFFRRLAEMMNNNSYNHDTDIENKYNEHKESQEAIYQLMNRLRQVAPSCSPQDVLQALVKCNYHKEREKLTRLLQLQQLTMRKETHL